MALGIETEQMLKGYTHENDGAPTLPLVLETNLHQLQFPSNTYSTGLQKAEIASKQQVPSCEYVCSRMLRIQNMLQHLLISTLDRDFQMP